MCEHLDADHACIYVLSSPDLWAAVAACAGVGEATMAGRAFSCDPRFNASAASAVLRAQQEDASSCLVLRSLPLIAASADSSAETSVATTAVQRIAAAAAASGAARSSPDDLPGDWQLLSEEHGCRQFAAVALANPAGELVGVLSLAAKGPVRPAGWNAPFLHSAVGLLATHIRRAQAVLASPALSQLHSAATFSDMVQAAAEAAADAAAAVAYVRGSSRVAIIHEEAGAAAIFQQQLAQTETDRAAALAQQLLKVRRSSCEYVHLPGSHLRKSVTHAPSGRGSMEASMHGGAAATPGMLQGDSWNPLRAACLTNASYATAMNTVTSYATANATNTLGHTISFTFPFSKDVPCKGHTLSLDKTLLGESLSKQVAGLCIDDCQTHTVSTKAYPRDLILSRGAVMPMSLALATASAEGKPLMALYVTFATTLPKPLLQAVVQELQQLLQAILPTVCAKLSGVLRPEYEYLARHLEDTACRRAETRSVCANDAGTARRSGETHSTSDRSEPSDGGADNLAPPPPPTESQLACEGEDQWALSFVLQVAVTAQANKGHGAGAEPLSPFCTPSTLSAQPPPAGGNRPNGTQAHRAPSFSQQPATQLGAVVGGVFFPGRGSTAEGREGAAGVVGGERPGTEEQLEGDMDVLAQLAPGADSPAKNRMLANHGSLASAIGAAPGSRLGRLGAPDLGRPLSACEAGQPTNRRLLTSLRSVSFRLEKAQAPRGASKLAPIIASMHERLRAAQAVQMAVSRSESRKADLRSVKLLQEIGQGGYGTVYRGTYHGAEVAVKVIKQSRLAGVHSSSNALASCSAGLGLHKQHLHDAIELVASVSMSHTNIVQVPAYFMDVRLEFPEEANPLDSVDQPTESRPFRLMHSPSLLESPALGQEGHGSHEGAMALVLEYCDCGSLCDAIMDRKFIEKVIPRTGVAQPGKTYLAINMRSVYTTLLEIALALRHMHSLALVHCDLKPQNVLLKSSPRDPRGFTAKLSDFGLSKMMAHDDHGQLVIDEAVASGTITHVAPEVLLGQKALGAAVDIYAFGILMFQTLSGMKVYDKNMSPSAIANAVAHKGMRPQMPSWVPQNYRTLAEACWEQSPADRPTADELVRGLERALEAKKSSSRPAANS